ATVARAARAAAGRAGARDAARVALAPTLEELQQSAFELLDRMLPLVPLSLPPRVEGSETLRLLETLPA
ncbi:MAG: hypothetical protein JOZ98_07230, partial [Solirubrobacterales bacterium]|nr:hypothetical protein [Solirubrobacterales bacterium]